jgi:hypothetical protein
VYEGVFSKKKIGHPSLQRNINIKKPLFVYFRKVSDFFFHQINPKRFIPQLFIAKIIFPVAKGLLSLTFLLLSSAFNITFD